METQKKCKQCGNSYPATSEYFHKNQNHLRPRCKICQSKNSKKVFKPKKCAICGSDYMPKSSISKYCSPECAYTADLRRRSKKPLTKECAFCGDTFMPYTSLDKFCSANCRIDNQKSLRSWNWNKPTDTITGKNNPAYRNGNYTRGVTKTAIGQRLFIKNSRAIKRSMVEEYGCIYCERCGTMNSLRFEAHHIIYRSEKPLHEHLHDKENIIVLCIKCHNDLHKTKGLRNDIVRDRELNELFGDDVLDK